MTYRNLPKLCAPLLALCALILLPMTAYAQTSVSGTINTETWTAANSPYRVTGALWVPMGETLTIEAGVDVLFDVDVQFIVQGAINVIGTASDSVRFMAGNSARWRGLRFIDGASGEFAYARIHDGDARDGWLDGFGGGLLVTDESTLWMEHSTISGNAAEGNGGGIAIVGGTVTLSYCEISGNTALPGLSMNDGGAIWNAFEGSSLTMINCTVSGNNANVGGGLYNEEATATLVNSIFWGNTASGNSPAMHILSGPVTARYSNIEGGIPAGVTDNGGNIDADPHFVDAANGDYTLQAGSPCIDAGDPLSPLDPDGTTADMGAYYFNQQTGPVVTSLSIPVVSSHSGGQFEIPVTATATGVRSATVTLLIDSTAFEDMFPVTASEKWGGNVMTDINRDGNKLIVGVASGTGVDFDDEVLCVISGQITDQSPPASVDLVWVANETEINGEIPEVLVNGEIQINLPPVWEPTDPQTGREGIELTFTVSATDPDTDPLTYAAENLPAGAAFDVVDKEFSWTPAVGDAGSHEAVFSVTDGINSPVELTVDITVAANKPPVWATTPDQTVNEGELLTFTIEATDDDDDPLTYGVDSMPDGAAFDPMTQEFTWTPTFDDAGEYQAVFNVTDGIAAAVELTVNITVIDVNRPPVWEEKADQVVEEGVELTFTVTAEDPDGDPLTYAAEALPAGAAFNPETREFVWTPDYGQAGEHEAVFSVSDGIAAPVELTVNITVRYVNRPPVWEHIDPPTGREGILLTFTLSASDPDEDDALTYGVDVESMPDGASFNAATQTFTWTPAVGDAGSHEMVFSVTDDVNDPVELTVTITITANNPPVWGPIADQTVNEGELLTFPVSATDADTDPADVLTYAAVSLPGDATFDPETQGFSWTPTFDDAGEYEAVFSVTDGIAAAVYDTVNITVIDVNRPPVWVDAVSDTATREGIELTFTLLAEDPDGDELVYAAEELPHGATFNSTTRVFTWTPTYEQAGDTVAVFSVTDDRVAEPVLHTVNITVAVHYGDASGDGTISATDASLVLQYVVKRIQTIRFLAANVSGGERISAWDAALILWKVVTPDYVFPVLGGDAPPKPAAMTQPALAWRATSDGWVLSASGGLGPLGADIVLNLPDGATLSSDEALEFTRDGNLVTIAIASVNATDLLSVTGVSTAPEVVSASVNDQETLIARPAEFSLVQNAPNPFNPSTTIRFGIEMDGPARLAIYDVNGRLVRTLVDGNLSAGHHEAVWDARDNTGRAVASGVYVYRLTSGTGVAMRRMVLVR